MNNSNYRSHAVGWMLAFTSAARFSALARRKNSTASRAMRQTASMTTTTNSIQAALMATKIQKIASDISTRIPFLTPCSILRFSHGSRGAE